MSSFLPWGQSRGPYTCVVCPHLHRYQYQGIVSPAGCRSAPRYQTGWPARGEGTPPCPRGDRMRPPSGAATAREKRQLPAADRGSGQARAAARRSPRALQHRRYSTDRGSHRLEAPGSLSDSIGTVHQCRRLSQHVLAEKPASAVIKRARAAQSQANIKTSIGLSQARTRLAKTVAGTESTSGSGRPASAFLCGVLSQSLHERGLSHADEGTGRTWK